MRIKPEGRGDLVAAIERARTDISTRIDDVSAQLTTGECDNVAAKVDQVIADGRQLEVFRGKLIFGTFFERHANRIGMEKKAFAYAVANQASRRPRATELVANAVKRISTYIPAEIVETLRQLASSHQSDVIANALQTVEAAQSRVGSGKRPTD